jgi:hypothetical protein
MRGATSWLHDAQTHMDGRLLSSLWRSSHAGRFDHSKYLEAGAILKAAIG